MPCDTIRLKPEQTLEERMEEVRQSIRKLQTALATGQVKVDIGPNGGVRFVGWDKERQGVTDVCAYRTLSAQGSSELRRAVARAEALSGRRVSPQAIAAGVHSHDGVTWTKH